LLAAQTIKIIDKGESRDNVDGEVWCVLNCCVLDGCVLNIFSAVYR
jgi:hypothetical protein